MGLKSRAYDKKEQCMLYNLETYSDETYLGRKEGTEEWVRRHAQFLIFQRESGCRDILHRPIFEEDIVRDKEGHRYRVLYFNKIQALSLYEIEEREFYPLERTEELEIIGHKYMKLEELRERQLELFPEPLLFNDLEELKQMAEKRKEPKMLSKKEKRQNPMVNIQPITRQEAVEIPSFVMKQKEFNHYENKRVIQSVPKSTQSVGKSLFSRKGTTRFFDGTREALKK